MNTRHSTLAILAVLSLATAGNLFAQRRTTSGGGSSGRSTPSGGGSRASGGGSSGGGSRGSSSGSSSPGARSSGSGGSQSSGSSGSSSSRGSRGSNGKSGGGAVQPSARGQSSEGNQASGTTTTGTLPATGKIGAVKRNARAVAASTHAGGGVYYGGAVYVSSCWNCGYWGYYGPSWGWYDYGWWYPAIYPYDHGRYYDADGGDGVVEGTEYADLGQGYMPYPYAENDGTGETFVRERTAERHGYSAITASYFNDVGSTTQAGHIQLEGAIRSFHFDIGYDHYAEPVQGHTDRLQTGRFSFGTQPAVGKRAYMIAGIGGRGVWLDDGQDSYGPEGTLGLQIFPAQPLGINVTGRLAEMSWTGHDWFTMTEVNTTGSLFLGRVELQAGWHWMKMEGSPGFGGPMVGTRLWF